MRETETLTPNVGVGKNVEHPELSLISDENVKLCNHLGKQFGFLIFIKVKCILHYEAILLLAIKRTRNIHSEKDIYNNERLYL